MSVTVHLPPTPFSNSDSDIATNNRPFLFISPHIHRGYIDVFVETFSSAFLHHQRILMMIAEPISRPARLHRYLITSFSLGVAVSSGLSAEDVVAYLEKYSRNMSSLGLITTASKSLAPSQVAISAFIHSCMKCYGIVSMSLESSGQCYLECKSKELLVNRLLSDLVIKSQIMKIEKSDCLSSDNVSAGVDEPYEVLVPQEHYITPFQSSNAPTNHIPSNMSAGAIDRPFDNENLQLVWRVPLSDIAACKVISQRCLELGYPTFQDYNFQIDTEVRNVNIHLRHQCVPRPYQVTAVEACVGSGRCRSGIIVLPCGAGKTLVGIMLVAAVKKRSLIVCTGSVSVIQWKNQIVDFAALNAPSTLYGSVSLTGSKNGVQRIACITGKEKDPVTEDTDIIITTYNMLSVARRLLVKLEAKLSPSEIAMCKRRQKLDSSSTEREKPCSVPELILRKNSTYLSRNAKGKLEFFKPFGLVVLDEVHVVPAEFFKESLSSINTRATVGLTATFVREDHKIEELYHLVGPKLYDISWQDLADCGYLARVICCEVHCPISTEFGVEYLNISSLQMERESNYGRNESQRKLQTSGDIMNDAKQKTPKVTLQDPTPLLVMLSASNPHKMMAVLQLAAIHRDDKVLVFCDHIVLLKTYAQLLQCPIVYGETSHKERLMIFSDFQSTMGSGGGACNIICISRVGDVSVNLPSANVVIQVSSHGGSRRQEAQRLGRILRPKNHHHVAHSARWEYASSDPLVTQVNNNSNRNSENSAQNTRDASMKRENNSCNDIGHSSTATSSPHITSSNNIHKNESHTLSSSESTPQWVQSILKHAEVCNVQAFFYSLVTDDSVEVPYASRRSQFLVDQGYPFQVVRYTPPISPPWIKHNNSVCKDGDNISGRINDDQKYVPTGQKMDSSNQNETDTVSISSYLSELAVKRELEAARNIRGITDIGDSKPVSSTTDPWMGAGSHGRGGTTNWRARGRGVTRSVLSKTPTIARSLQGPSSRCILACPSDLWSRRWRVEFLARVVSQWELKLQLGASSAPKSDRINPSSGDGIWNISSLRESTLARGCKRVRDGFQGVPRRPIAQLKREVTSILGYTTIDEQEMQISDQGVRRGLLGNDLIDDLVYHEF